MPLKTQPRYVYRGRFDLRVHFDQTQVGGQTAFAKLTPSALFGNGPTPGNVNAVHGSDRTLKAGETETLDLTDGSLLSLDDKPVRFTRLIAWGFANNDDPAKTASAIVVKGEQSTIPVHAGTCQAGMNPSGVDPGGKITISNPTAVDADFSVVLAGWQDAPAE